MSTGTEITNPRPSKAAWIGLLTGIGLQVAAVVDIGEGGMGQINLVGTPTRRGFGPFAPVCGRLQGAAEKGELKAEALTTGGRDAISPFDPPNNRCEKNSALA